MLSPSPFRFGSALQNWKWYEEGKRAALLSFKKPLQGSGSLNDQLHFSCYKQQSLKNWIPFVQFPTASGKLNQAIASAGIIFYAKSLFKLQASPFLNWNFCKVLAATHPFVFLVKTNTPRIQLKHWQSYLWRCFLTHASVKGHTMDEYCKLHFYVWLPSAISVTPNAQKSNRLINPCYGESLALDYVAGNMRACFLFIPEKTANFKTSEYLISGF